MPDSLLLWPNETSQDPEDQPSVTPYLMDDGESHPLVLVLPGGGYGHLAPHEGEPIAQRCNEYGFHAAVLKYRLGPRHAHPAMIHDAQRAMRLVRAHASDWRIADGRIAALGFSAGGHLTSTLAVHYDHFPCENDDLVGKQSARPDAAVLCYAVIDLAGRAAHTGSRRNLFGDASDASLVATLSNQQQVTAQTPPTFLWHTADDAAVPVENSFMFFAACRKQQVPAELHVYESGRHGLGLAYDTPDVVGWFDLAMNFLHRHLDSLA